MMSVLKNKPLSSDELAVIYASLILVDDDVPVTEDKINTILGAAAIKVEQIWPTLYSKAITSCNVRKLISSVSGGPVGGATDAMPAAAASSVEESKPEAKSAAPAVDDDDSDESDDDMGLSLFD